MCVGSQRAPPTARTARCASCTALAATAAWPNFRRMCRVAVDRVLRLAEKRSLSAPFEHWRLVRNDIQNEIWSDFFDDDLGHFVQAKGSRAVDAVLLLMPLANWRP